MSDEQTPRADQQPPSAEQPEQQPRQQPASAERLQPRSGPIVAGVLVLIVCAFVVVKNLGGSIDVTTWVIATVIGLGALLLAVGIAVLVRDARRRHTD